MKNVYARDIRQGDKVSEVFLVADGMGGHAAGEVASRLAADEIARTLARHREADSETWPEHWNMARSAAANLVVDAIMAGLKACGEHFETGEYFLPELIGAAETFKAGMVVLSPRLAAGDRTSQGTVILGTVQGDVHDIGKNLVCMMLEGGGYTVIDVGVDVPGDKFVEEVKKSGLVVVINSRTGEVMREKLQPFKIE